MQIIAYTTDRYRHTHPGESEIKCPKINVLASERMTWGGGGEVSALVPDNHQQNRPARLWPQYAYNTVLPEPLMLCAAAASGSLGTREYRG